VGVRVELAEADLDLDLVGTHRFSRSARR